MGASVAAFVMANGPARLAMARAALRLLQLHVAGTLHEEVQLVDSTTAFVRSFGEERLVRHAEPSDARPRTFPATLKPMKLALAHAGARSFERAVDNFYTVDRHSGRCDCDASHYFGVVSAVGTCKHARLYRSVEALQASDEGEARVLEAARRVLYTLVHERERSKPEAARCVPLYAAKDADEIVALLGTHISVPGTGKSTGLDDTSGAPRGSSSGAAGSSNEPVPLAERRCPFAVAPAASAPYLDLGLVFTPCEPCDHELDSDELVEGGLELLVAACSRLWSGGVGPAPHTGDSIRPGDVVFAMNGDSKLTLPYIQADQTLCWPASKPLTLHFCRPPPPSSLPAEEPLTDGPSVGGRPAARQAKYPASGARQANARSGGVPARRGRKPHDVSARLQKQLKIPSGSLRTQVEQASEQLLGPGYMNAEVTRLSALADTDTYVP